MEPTPYMAAVVVIGVAIGIAVAFATTPHPGLVDPHGGQMQEMSEMGS